MSFRFWIVRFNFSTAARIEGTVAVRDAAIYKTELKKNRFSLSGALIFRTSKGIKNWFAGPE